MATLVQASPTAPADAARTDQIRNSMSVANLITAPTQAPPAETTARMDASPPSSLQALASVEEPIGAPSLSMVELPGAINHGQSAQLGETSNIASASAEVKKESGHKDDASDIMDESGDGDASDNAEDVPDDQREFLCMNDPCGRCMTGQYTKDLSRKVISDHFGRNKACTRDIVDWPLFCRKHYQRATYNKPRWQVRKVELILRQFDLIDAQYPGTTYDIHFKKSEEARLNRYSRLCTGGMTELAAEQFVLPVAGKHFEAPIRILRELDHFVKKGMGYDAVREVVDLISQMLDAGDTEQVPSIEFLPNVPKAKKSPSKASASRSPRTPKGRSKTPKSPGTPSRVSAKGSVKKTSG